MKWCLCNTSPTPWASLQAVFRSRYLKVTELLRAEQSRFWNLFEMLTNPPTQSDPMIFCGLVWTKRPKFCHVQWCYLDQKIAMIKANNDPISKGWRCSGTCFPDATWTTIETNLLGVSNLRDAAMHFIWFDQDMGTLVQSGLNFTSQNRRNSWSLHHFPPFFYPLVRSISTQNKTLFGCFNGHAASVIPFPTSVLA